jgi:hypothetical protein
MPLLHVFKSGSTTDVDPAISASSKPWNVFTVELLGSGTAAAGPQVRGSQVSQQTLKTYSDPTSVRASQVSLQALLTYTVSPTSVRASQVSISVLRSLILATDGAYLIGAGKLTANAIVIAGGSSPPDTGPVDDWPDSLPQCPILNSFTEQRQDNIIPFAPDVGPPKIHRRSSSAAMQSSMAFRMTSAQLLVFNNFFEVTLKDGSLPYTWKHPITQIVYTWRFETGAAPRIDRMTPNTFRVTFTLLR